jgi:hypothetical protein
VYDVLELLHVLAVVAPSGQWERWGALALLTPAAALALVGLKPSL